MRRSFNRSNSVPISRMLRSMGHQTKEMAMSNSVQYRARRFLVDVVSAEASTKYTVATWGGEKEAAAIAMREHARVTGLMGISKQIDLLGECSRDELGTYEIAPGDVVDRFEW